MAQPFRIGVMQLTMEAARGDSRARPRDGRGRLRTIWLAEALRVMAEALDGGAPGVNLTPDGDRTSMRWTADVRIAGPIGSMGQRVFQPIVNQQVGNVLDALEAQVAEAKNSGSG